MYQVISVDLSAMPKASSDSVCSAVGVLPLSLQYGFSVVEKYVTRLCFFLLEFVSKFGNVPFKLHGYGFLLVHFLFSLLKVLEGCFEYRSTLQICAV